MLHSTPRCAARAAARKTPPSRGSEPGVHRRAGRKTKTVLAIELVDPFQDAQAGTHCTFRIVSVCEAVVSLHAARDGGALATGDVVNTAARLQSAAPPGSLIVGDQTYRATRHAIRYADFDPVDAKGKAEAVTAWLAVEPSLEPAERPIVANAMVGRARELDLMRSGEDDVAATAYGEAAALIEEFATTLAPTRATGLLAAPDVEEILSLAGRRPAD